MNTITNTFAWRNGKKTTKRKRWTRTSSDLERVRFLLLLLLRLAVHHLLFGLRFAFAIGRFRFPPSPFFPSHTLFHFHLPVLFPILALLLAAIVCVCVCVCVTFERCLFPLTTWLRYRVAFYCVFQFRLQFSVTGFFKRPTTTATTTTTTTTKRNKWTTPGGPRDQWRYQNVSTTGERRLICKFMLMRYRLRLYTSTTSHSKDNCINCGEIASTWPLKGNKTSAKGTRKKRRPEFFVSKFLENCWKLGGRTTATHSII